ncbi:MAG: hypothetical protein ACT4OJ_10830, partial [Bacteroidota bacterium]
MKKLILIFASVVMVQLCQAQKGGVQWDSPKLSAKFSLVGLNILDWEPPAGIPGFVPYKSKNQHIGLAADSLMYLPVKDTTHTPARIGGITIRPQDTSVYVGIRTSGGGVKWAELARFSDLAGYLTTETDPLSWKLLGTPSTNPLNNYVGTSDSNFLLFRTNGKTAGMISRYGRTSASGGINFTNNFLFHGQYAGGYMIDSIINGVFTHGYQNVLYGPGAGWQIGGTNDTTAYNAGKAPSTANTIIGLDAAPYVQRNPLQGGDARNTIMGYGNCFACLTPGENAFYGVYNAEHGYRPYKNTAIGSNALRTANDAEYMTAIGAYASVYTGCSVSGITNISSSSDWTTGTATFSAPANWGSPGVCMVTATANIVISGGQIVGISDLVPGCGYNILSGRYFNGAVIPKPTVTFSGDGTSASADVTITCGSNSVAVGHTAGWFVRAPQKMIYIGAGSEPSTRYFDRMGGAFGYNAGVHSSVPATTDLNNAWAFGTEAKVATNRTFVIGGVDTTLKVVINKETGDSTLSVYEGGVYIEGGLRVANPATGIPASAKRPMFAADGTMYLADTLTGFITGSGTVSGSKKYFPKFTASGAIGNSRMIEIDGGSGNYISIDDLQTGATTTNDFLFNVRNAFPGDASSSANPLVIFASTEAAITSLNILKMQGTNMNTGTNVQFSLGRTSASKNMFFWSFNYEGNNSDANYIKEVFHSVDNIRRVYASGNTVFNLTADNGYKVQVGGTLGVNNYVDLLDISLPATPSAGYGRLFTRLDTLRFVNDVGTEFTLGAGGGGGNVTKVGTPVDNQIGVWTGDGTIEGDADFTFNGTDLTVGGAATLNNGNNAAGDVIIKGQTENNLFWTDASKDEVYVGGTTDNGAYEFQV